MYEFTREIQGNVNYLVLRLQPTDVIDDMAMGMLSNNRIQGISPVTKRWEKQSFALYYTVSSLTPLVHCAGIFGDERRLMQLFRSYCQMMMESEEYLLEQGCMLLNQEYVFVRAATGDISVIYLPLLDYHSDATPKAFLNKLIHSAVRELPQDSPLVNVLLRESFQDDFVPAEFLERLDRLNNRSQASQQPSPKPHPQTDVRTSQPQQEEKPAQQFKQESRPQVAAPAFQVSREPKTEQRQDEPIEKKGLFGFGAKKDANKKKKPKKEVHLTEEETCDNPFATGGKIPPRGPVAAQPEPEEKTVKPEHRKAGGLGALFGLGGNKSQNSKWEDSQEQDTGNPFTQKNSFSVDAAPQKKVQPEPIVQPQQSGMRQSPAGSGYTIDLGAYSNSGPQATVAMGDGFGAGGKDQPAGFPVVWLEEKNSGNRVQITHDNFHVGRKLDTDDIVDYAVLTATPYMGSDHCYFVCHGGRMFVVDNNSFNGTWVNGQRITPGTEVPIEQGTVIRMADVTFIVR